MRILIVDDERPARDKLRKLLEQEADVKAIAEARDGVDAMQQIAAFAPDALFLDIQMPEVSGLELAASLPAPAPLIVFATAFDEYALKAFDTNAIDYLLKPYDQARLQRALERLRERLLARSAQPLPPFAGEHALRQLLMTERGVTRVIRVDQIGWIETADNYVVLHTAGEQPLMRQTLAGLLDKLGLGFVRCHRRAAVQLAWITRVEALDKGDCELVLRDGARVPCSRQYRAAVIALL
ncbi:LytR/AlgR family response regulator transcription factor [Massilia antarctica]|uniref:LytR/AlgR family response regulator transcription factor n=1 Tax=Massilia antarctica TaxID=2765360 RepID=UPI0006BB60BA|nr:response regulator [Massilia sp. H27-R4]MCY0913905.1 response regulator [Massilia sp. H27-R4]CUI04362.1 Autolysis response regulater LytR [Janthinobacterium sp. CG23_2]CUU28148.1 Autolysis response regulater LytR [Janthinobacterium sp. CG23_2]